MKTSENTKQLFEKLFTALNEMPVIEKERGGNGIKYKYMDLDTLINKTKPILKSHDLAFTQSVGNIDGKQSLTTRIFHKSGEWIEDTTVLPHAKLAGGCNEAQEMGSSITYLRRYSLCAMLGIVSDDDTDGVPPSSKLPASYQQVKSEPRPKEATPDPDLKELGNILNSTNNGKPVFTEEEKQMYRDKVEKGAFKKKLIEEAKAQLQEKLTGGQQEQLPIF